MGFLSLRKYRQYKLALVRDKQHKITIKQTSLMTTVESDAFISKRAFFFATVSTRSQDRPLRAATKDHEATIPLRLRVHVSKNLRTLSYVAEQHAHPATCCRATCAPATCCRATCAPATCCRACPTSPDSSVVVRHFREFLHCQHFQRTTNASGKTSTSWGILCRIVRPVKQPIEPDRDFRN
jgi:hypothetical protein